MSNGYSKWAFFSVLFENIAKAVTFSMDFLVRIYIRLDQCLTSTLVDSENSLIFLSSVGVCILRANPLYTQKCVKGPTFVFPFSAL